MQLEDLKPGLRIEGVIPGDVITVIAAQWHGSDALELTYKNANGGLGQQVVFRRDQDKLSIAQTGTRSFDAAASDFKLVAEAQRISLAGVFDPMLAVATSDVQPLPHQIRAVYGELLPRTPRFALGWYRQHGYGIGKFGDADNLARARNTSVDVMDRDEILSSRAGNVQLTAPSELPWTYDVLKDAHTGNWEALDHLMKVLERDGIAPAGNFLQAALSRPDGAIDADLIKELAHLLFRIAEGNGWTKDALSFNTLVTTWPEILEVARAVKKPLVQQGAFDFDEED